MEQRGILVRREAVGWLRTQLAELPGPVPTAIDDLRVAGSDGSGRKTEIPWVRVFSSSRSPSATLGFYAVYLFSASGSQAYLSLNQGTNRWANGELHPRPDSELEERVEWARAVLAPDLARRSDHLQMIDLEAMKSLGRGYEVGNIAALRYGAGEAPSEALLREDLSFIVGALGRLYVAADRSLAVPGEPAPEVADTMTMLERTVRPRPRSRSLRTLLRLSASERTAIERRAVRVATDHLKAQGYGVKDVGATQSYDLDARRGGERLYVEVKGSTSNAAEVILTKNEVDLHTKVHPATMLLVVSAIELNRDSDPPEATGGALHQIHPWKIAEEDLTPIAFRYVVPGPG